MLVSNTLNATSVCEANGCEAVFLLGCHRSRTQPIFTFLRKLYLQRHLAKFQVYMSSIFTGTYLILPHTLKILGIAHIYCKDATSLLMHKTMNMSEYIFSSSVSKSMKSMALSFLVHAILHVHPLVSPLVASEWVTVSPLKPNEYWLPDWEKFRTMMGIRLRSRYQFAHLPAEAFSWAPQLKVREYDIVYINVLICNVFMH